MFFNIGAGEVLVIAMVALIAVGPEQLPSVLRKIGRSVAQVRSMTSGLRDEFMSGIDEVSDIVDPERWMGSGSESDPVVPRGFAAKQAEQAKAEQERRNSDQANDAADGEPATSADSPNGGAFGGGPLDDAASDAEDTVVNEIARANAMKATETPRPKPAIDASSTTEARPRVSPDEPSDPPSVNGELPVEEAEANPTPASSDGDEAENGEGDDDGESDNAERIV